MYFRRILAQSISLEHLRNTSAKHSHIYFTRTVEQNVSLNNRTKYFTRKTGTLSKMKFYFCWKLKWMCQTFLWDLAPNVRLNEARAHSSTGLTRLAWRQMLPRAKCWEHWSDVSSTRHSVLMQVKPHMKHYECWNVQDCETGDTMLWGEVSVSIAESYTAVLDVKQAGAWTKNLLINSSWKWV
jgi:hypothetical protein